MTASANSKDRPTADRLISVAGEIFAQKGRAATVREICSAAGCSVAAINYHFGDKQRLYLRCVQTACEHKQRLFPLPTVSVESAPDELLRCCLRMIACRMVAKSNVSWHNTLMLREVISPSEGVQDLLQEPFQQDFELIQSIVGRVLGTDLDSSDLRQSYTTQIIARCMFLRTGKNLRRMLGLDRSENEVPEAYADSITDSILLQLAALGNATAAAAPPETSGHNINDNPARKVS